MSPFFIDGPVSELRYLNARDHHKAFVESLWNRYCRYADSMFQRDACDHFLQRFWEMYLGVALLNRGFSLDKHGDAGPEFSAQIDGERVWFEAIAPTPGIGPDLVPELVPTRDLRKVPVEKILLRFTNALAVKKERYQNALNKGIIAQKDRYILAINSRGISPGAPYGNQVPYFVRAFLPIGPLAVAIDPNSLEVTDSFHQYRPQIAKANREPVSTRAFLDQDAAFCSAVIHSAVDCANHPAEIGADFSVLHNPLAKHPIREAAFPWWTQYTMRDDALHRSEPNTTG